MGAKASLFEVSEPGSILPSPTLENIKAAYEDKEVELARELIQQACCVECSAGMPRVHGVSPDKTTPFNDSDGSLSAAALGIHMTGN